MSTRTPTKKPAKKAAAKPAPKGNILEHLEKLPSPYKEMAVYNYHKQNYSSKYEHSYSLYSAISCAFEWGKTDQGESFWSNVQDATDEEMDCDYPGIPDTTKTKTWEDVVPDYKIVVDKKKSIITVGCQEIDLEEFKQFVEEFNEFVE